METLQISVSQEDVGVRIDKLLSKHFPLHSRTYFQYLIDQNFVKVNGTFVKKRIIPKLNDKIEIFFSLPPEISLDPENIPLDILYEDTHLIIINKPAELVVHPAIGHKSHTFVNGLLHHCKNLEKGEDPLRPGIVHRLDKDTTGVLIAAKTVQAHQNLVAQFAQRTIIKKYLAICVHKLTSTTVDEPIGRHPVHRKKMSICPNGKKALSHFRCLAYKDPLSLVEATLETGRTHQLRVHLQHLHTPILGDPIYGIEKFNKKYDEQRQLLHAHKINFFHPLTAKPLEIIAPPPVAMKKYLKIFAKEDL